MDLKDWNYFKFLSIGTTALYQMLYYSLYLTVKPLLAGLPLYLNPLYNGHGHLSKFYLSLI